MWLTFCSSSLLLLLIENKKEKEKAQFNVCSVADEFNYYMSMYYCIINVI